MFEKKNEFATKVFTIGIDKPSGITSRKLQKVPLEGFEIKSRKSEKMRSSGQKRIL